MSGLRVRGSRNRAATPAQPGLDPAQWPFAWCHDDGSGGLAPVAGTLVRRRVTQCALSRVCGACAEPLGRPVVFLGDPEEVARNAFHAPPLHLTCANELRRVPGADPGWQIVTTAGFDFVRPGRDEPETEPLFCPNSLL